MASETGSEDMNSEVAGSILTVLPINTQFVPLVESGICLLVDVATLSTIYDVRHPLLLPPGYLTQELISRP